MSNEFVEEPIVPKNQALANLIENIKRRGLNFHPGKVLKELDQEAERQFSEICESIFKGMNVDRLVAIQTEVYEWMKKEDDRYDVWKNTVHVPSPALSSIDEDVLSTTAEETANMMPPKATVKKGKK